MENNEMKLKFENINFDNPPKFNDAKEQRYFEHICFELETIREETDDFQDEDAVEIFQREFRWLYSTMAKKFPTALKDYTPPQPSPEEVEAKIKDEKFMEFINSGNEKLRAKDFVGALSDFNSALSLGVNNEVATSMISGAEAEKAKHEKLLKAKELAGKYKKKESAPAQ